MPAYIVEPERSTPVIAEADLCVAGGSCTGVFAAVRAARLGLRVVLIEKQNMLGGTAVCGLVNVWHSLRDTDNRNQIIAGLTDEVIERLHQKGAVLFSADPNTAYKFNPWELACILDRLIKEHKITVMLHTTYVAAVHADQKVQAVIVENPDGRGAVRAGFFIDATGGGRIARDLGIPHYEHDSIQPPSSCFHLMGETDGVDLGALIRSHG